MSGPEGLFVAAACNDGSLPVLAVEDSPGEARRAIMAIEPVESHLAREERFKCIIAVRGYHVVTANSAGVVSLMNLEGAVRMITSDEDEESEEGDESHDSASEGDSSHEEDDDSVELAVDIIESTRLGTGARITCLVAWCMTEEIQEEKRLGAVLAIKEPSQDQLGVKHESGHEEPRNLKRKPIEDNVTMDDAAITKARSLVQQAKSLKKKKDKKKKSKLTN
jgi:hypothetical protein